MQMNNREEEEDLVRKASAFALKAHIDCKYGDLPYKYHLQMVVETLVYYCPAATDTMIAAAWLHDTVEDTSVTLFDIREEFGGNVARMVDFCTDPTAESREERKSLANQKLIKASWPAKAVKLADRVANMKASIENPKMAAVYRQEFPDFIRAVGIYPQTMRLLLEAHNLYMNSVEAYCK